MAEALAETGPDRLRRYAIRAAHLQKRGAEHSTLPMGEMTRPAAGARKVLPFLLGLATAAIRRGRRYWLAACGCRSGAL
jgi:hypothetical protein